MRSFVFRAAATLGEAPRSQPMPSKPRLTRCFVPRSSFSCPAKDSGRTSIPRIHQFAARVARRRQAHGAPRTAHCSAGPPAAHSAPTPPVHNTGMNHARVARNEKRPHPRWLRAACRRRALRARQHIRTQEPHRSYRTDAWQLSMVLSRGCPATARFARRGGIAQRRLRPHCARSFERIKRRL